MHEFFKIINEVSKYVHCDTVNSTNNLLIRIRVHDGYSERF